MHTNLHKLNKITLIVLTLITQVVLIYLLTVSDISHNSQPLFTLLLVALPIILTLTLTSLYLIAVPNIHCIINFAINFSIYYTTIKLLSLSRQIMRFLAPYLTVRALYCAVTIVIIRWPEISPEGLTEYQINLNQARSSVIPPHCPAQWEYIYSSGIRTHVVNPYQDYGPFKFFGRRFPELIQLRGEIILLSSITNFDTWPLMFFYENWPIPALNDPRIPDEFEAFNTDVAAHVARIFDMSIAETILHQK